MCSAGRLTRLPGTLRGRLQENHKPGWVQQRPQLPQPTVLADAAAGGPPAGSGTGSSSNVRGPCLGLQELGQGSSSQRLERDILGVREASVDTPVLPRPWGSIGGLWAISSWPRPVSRASPSCCNLVTLYCNYLLTCCDLFVVKTRDGVLFPCGHQGPAQGRCTPSQAQTEHIWTDLELCQAGIVFGHFAS